MIRIEEVWMAVEPLDMRAGTDTALGPPFAIAARVSSRRVMSAAPEPISVTLGFCPRSRSKYACS
jgi:hypothetical protein